MSRQPRNSERAPKDGCDMDATRFSGFDEIVPEAELRMGNMFLIAYPAMG
jgi:hypothetical protein